jgi:ATPase subunit of ABC transporter with duplicated ATPase domains
VLEQRHGLGVAAKKAILDRYNELMMNYSDETADEAPSCRTRSTARTCGTSTARSRWRWTRCAARPATPMSTSCRAARSAASRSAAAAAKPDLLLLDEPTNHLDAETTAWLEKHLREYPGAVLIVTHDRYFLDNVTGWILELDRGRGIPYEGNYSAYLHQPRPSAWSRKAARTAARQKALEREREWMGLAQGASGQVEGPYQGL